MLLLCFLNTCPNFTESFNAQSADFRACFSNAHCKCTFGNCGVQHVPLIDYGSVTWGATSNGNIERLSKLQTRATRMILHADFTTPSALMFKELGWLSVTDRLKHNKATLVYKALTNKTPDYITNLLKPMPESTVNRIWYII